MGTFAAAKVSCFNGCGLMPLHSVQQRTSRCLCSGKILFSLKKRKRKKTQKKDKKEPQKLKTNHNMCDDAPDQNNTATFFHF